LDERLVQASDEWARLKANVALECRNCHDFESMDLTRQGARAAQVHKLWLGTGEKTCIDCHKGIAHRLPDIAGVPQGSVPPTWRKPPPDRNMRPRIEGVVAHPNKRVT